nr:MAG TPA: protein of unknown function (DUF4754) [Caudoviricetes sp.]
MSVNREEFEKAFDGLDKGIRGLIKTASYANEMVVLDELREFANSVGSQVKNIQYYVNQLEKELKKYKQKPQIKQTVVRTYPFEREKTTEYLKKHLNDGYRVVMANHIEGKKCQNIEYILEKEVIEDE